jgi:hypothetical protein
VITIPINHVTDSWTALDPAGKLSFYEEVSFEKFQSARQILIDTVSDG